MILYLLNTIHYTRKLSPRGQRGFEAKIFCLSLGLVLILVQYASFSRRLSLVSLSIIEITSFTLRSSLVGNCCLLCNIQLKLTFEQCIDNVTAILGVNSWVDKFYVGAHAFIIQCL